MRGRKPKSNRKGYFYEEEENAFVNYLKSESKKEKEEIFNNILLPAFTKMTESIIRRYKLYPPDEEYIDTFNDTISFLMTKIEKFNPESNFKAYSYCGTIIKNYLIYKINLFHKNLKRNESFEDIQNELNESTKYSTENEKNILFLEELINNIIDKIKEMIENKIKYKLSEDEIIVGEALIDLLSNWDDLLVTDGSNKFNKSSVLLLLKEYTNMPTKEVRKCMKKYKNAYFLIKDSMLE